MLLFSDYCTWNSFLIPCDYGALKISISGISLTLKQLESHGCFLSTMATEYMFSCEDILHMNQRASIKCVRWLLHSMKRRTRSSVHIYIYVYVCVYICICVYIYVYIYAYAVRCCHDAVSFLHNSHNTHPTVHPWGRGMGCLFWARNMSYVLLLSLQHRM